MSASRTAILARLRAAAHPAPAPVAPWRPAITDLSGTFVTRLEGVFGTSETLQSPAEIPAAVTRYLTAHGLPLQAAVTPEFAALDWQKAGISRLPAPAKASVSTAIARAEAASAETGTLLLSSRDTAGPWPNLLADTYIAVLEKASISASFEDAVTRRAGNSLPRSLHAVTGPSRTGDIEQTLELGAHGAVRVHVLLLP